MKKKLFRTNHLPFNTDYGRTHTHTLINYNFDFEMQSN